MTPPTNIDGTDISGATIDGQTVQEITVDGDTVFTAIPDTLVDDYNDGDLSEYTAYSNGSNIDTTTTNAVEGSHSASNDGTRLQGAVVSEFGDGLDYPEANDTVAFLIRQPSDSSTRSQTGPTFNTRLDADNHLYGYTFTINVGTDDLNVIKHNNDTGGDRSFINNFNATISAQTWYWGQVSLPDSNGNMSYDLYKFDKTKFQNGDIVGSRGSKIGGGTVTDTDVDHTNRGVGIYGERVGSGAAVDWIAVIDPSNF